MTRDRLVEVLRELRALDRVRVVISRHGTDPDWQDALTLISDRVFWLRGCVSLEDPGLVTSASAILDAERTAAAPAGPVPNSLRVH